MMLVYLPRIACYSSSRTKSCASTLLLGQIPLQAMYTSTPSSSTSRCCLSSFMFARDMDGKVSESGRARACTIDAPA
jgi:hypothetical protein